MKIVGDICTIVPTLLQGVMLWRETINITVVLVLGVSFICLS